MRLITLSLILSILLQIKCDTTLMDKKEACRKATISIFGNYYSLSKSMHLSTIPNRIFFMGGTIVVSSVTLPFFAVPVYIPFGNFEIFQYNQRILARRKGRRDFIDIFATTQLQIHAFELDRIRGIIFVLLKRSRNDRMKTLYAIRLNDLSDPQNTCPWKYVSQIISRNYLSLKLNEVTGELYLGYEDRNNGFIESFKPSKTDPCKEFTDVSYLTKDFENRLSDVQKEIEKCTKENERLRNMLSNLSNIHANQLRQLLNEKEGNETILMNRIEELKQKDMNAKNNRILMGAQISYLVDDLEGVIFNTTTSFPSKIPYESVDTKNRKQYECALKADFEADEKQNELLNFTNTNLYDNLKALQNEAVAPDEIEEFNSVKLTDNEVIDEIFG